MTDMISRACSNVLGLYRQTKQQERELGGEFDVMPAPRDVVLAVLSALEEPSEAMVRAGMTHRLAVEKPNIHDTAGIFAAMIKAAKGEE